MIWFKRITNNRLSELERRVQHLELDTHTDRCNHQRLTDAHNASNQARVADHANLSRRLLVVENLVEVEKLDKAASLLEEMATALRAGDKSNLAEVLTGTSNDA